jgi:hypothetical protein
MSIFKEDIQQAKQRLAAWWNHEIIDRPCISYWNFHEGEKYTIDDMREVLDPWYLAQHWDDINPCLDVFERNSQKIYYGGENLPRFFPNYGPGIMAAVLGIEPLYKACTVWFRRPTSFEEIIPLLENAQINMNNPWFARLRKVIEVAAQRAGNRYCIAMTDLGGILDILASFLGSEQVILAMKRQPDLIDTCRAIILEKTLKVYDALQTIVEHYGDGCNSWLNLWSPKRWYPIQCDFSYLLSPAWFQRFVLPDIITQAEHLNYAIYHLDGPNQLKYLDDLLTISSLHGIQWVPGAQEAPKCSDKWMPVYRKIQAAGKAVIIDFFEDLKPLSHFYTTLDPKRLFISLFSYESIKLQYFLPPFIGGQGGSGDFKTFRRTYRQQVKLKKVSNS